MDNTNLFTKGSTQTLTFRVKRNVNDIFKSEPTDDGTSSPKAAKVITTRVSSFGSACSERQSVEKDMQLAFGSQPTTSSPTPSSSSALYRHSLGNVVPLSSGTLASTAFVAKPFDFNEPDDASTPDKSDKPKKKSAPKKKKKRTIAPDTRPLKVKLYDLVREDDIMKFTQGNKESREELFEIVMLGLEHIEYLELMEEDEKRKKAKKERKHISAEKKAEKEKAKKERERISAEKKAQNAEKKKMEDLAKQEKRKRSDIVNQSISEFRKEVRITKSRLHQDFLNASALYKDAEENRKELSKKEKEAAKIKATEPEKYADLCKKLEAAKKAEADADAAKEQITEAQKLNRIKETLLKNAPKKACERKKLLFGADADTFPFDIVITRSMWIEKLTELRTELESSDDFNAKVFDPSSGSPFLVSDNEESEDAVSDNENEDDEIEIGESEVGNFEHHSESHEETDYEADLRERGFSSDEDED